MQEKKLSTNERWAICKKCPICDTDLWLCNSNLWLRVSDMDISTNPKEGYVRGCGCYLPHKIKNLSKHCPTQQW